MAFNTDTLIENFVTIIQDRITGPVIIGEDTNAGPRPDRVTNPEGFSSCRINSLLELGRPEYSAVDNNGNQIIKVQDKVEIQIQTFGPNAIGRLNCLKLEFRKRSFKSQLVIACLSFISASDVLNISTTLDTDWEERAQMTISFYISASIEDNVGIIENANITETYNDDPGTVVKTVQNNITTP